MYKRQEKIREVIGSGGKVIQKISADCGVKIDIEDDGHVLSLIHILAKGYECGVTLEKFADIKEGDIFEAYITEEYRD